ncbi:MAG: hypothetical protein ACFFBP_21000 [Promethearchaeota archaeon]
MIFQILLRNVPDFQYIINAIIAILGRSLDIISTRYVSKELKLETNKFARRLGWPGAILIQIPLIILGSLDFYLALFLFVWSFYLFANNLEGSWYVKQVGEEQYKNELKDQLNQSKTLKIILGEISSLLTYTISGILILIFIFVFNDFIGVVFICSALIFQGIVGTIRSIKYLFELKKEKTLEEN